MTKSEMIEARAKLATRIRELADKLNDNPTDEARANWDKLNRDYDDLTARIDQAERLETIDGHLNAQHDELRDIRLHRERSGLQPRAADLDREQRRRHNAIAFRGWLLHQAGIEYRARNWRESCQLVGIDHRSKWFDVRLPTGRRETRDLDVATATEGPELIDTDFASALVAELEFVGSARNYCRVISRSGGGNMLFPVVSDTATDAAIVAEENIGSFVDPDFDQVSIGSYKYGTSVRWSAELGMDSEFNLAAELGMLVGQRMARGQNGHFTTGSGAGQPAGYVTNADANTNAEETYSVATGLAGDDIIDLYHKVDPAHRGPGFAFVCHDTVLAAVRKLKGSDNNYLWQPGLSQGAPDRLIGQPLYVNQNHDPDYTVALQKGIMSAGQHRAHVILDTGPMRLRVLQERYADTDQIAMVALWRSDSDTLTQTDWTHPPICILNTVA